MDKEEKDICRLFISKLETLGRTLQNPIESDTWPDCVCKEDDKRIGIELTTLDIKRHRREASIHDEYEVAIKNRLKPWPEKLKGLYIQVAIPLDLVPRANSAQGFFLIDRIIEQILSDDKMVESARKGLQTAEKVTGTNYSHIMLFYMPLRPGAAGEVSVLYAIGSWEGENRLRLSEAIKRKMIYTSFEGDGLILLVYSLHAIPIDPESDEISLAQQMLGSMPHPFDEVWYMLPLAENRSPVIQIWPSNNHGIG